MYRRSLLTVLLLLILGCGNDREERAIGEAFVAPATLNLRKDLGPRQPSVATLKHGERVEILGNRRRFVKVRSRAGMVGWTDTGSLFSPEQMEKLRALAERANRLPSQGDATVLDTLNVHTEPDRPSPSFHQIREGEHVAVVAHQLTPRAQAELPPDDWSLVRISPNQAGWVLTRMLFMTIPDEVAQYAEGHRITSYFSLGDVQDGGQVKHNWLWTTIEKGREPYQFDSFRVFVWSLRRHRYETAYIERKLKGYYPVRVIPAPGAPPQFSLVVEEKDGSRMLRTYMFQGFRVRLVSRVPWMPEPEPSAAESTPSSQDRQNQSWPGRLRRAWLDLFRKKN